MLEILLLSFLCALICTVITVVVPKIVSPRKGVDVLEVRIKYGIYAFLSEFAYMLIVLYASCSAQTIWSVLIWMFPILIVNAVVAGLYKGIPETCFNSILAGISLVFCLSQFLGPVQNLVYVHDMENVDVTYTISSEEIFAKMKLKIGTNDKWKNQYCSKEPEMRNVNGKNIAVYKIENNTDDGSTEYIPGYAIQETNGTVKIVQKRIYFDTSYCNKRDALRTIRRQYPTVILGDHKFDIDDNWNPYEVYTYRESLYSSDGKDYGLIILNLRNGKAEKYPASENKIPSWVDFKSTEPR